MTNRDQSAGPVDGADRGRDLDRDSIRRNEGRHRVGQKPGGKPTLTGRGSGSPRPPGPRPGNADGSGRSAPREVRWLPVEALTPDPRNARVHSSRQVARIADSIAAFGFNVPVLIDEKGFVLAGHGRVLAARRLGLDEVPTIALDHMTEAESRAFKIADNRLAELASWDDGRLRLELEELKELDLDFALSATGFEMDEIDLRIGDAGPGDAAMTASAAIDPRARSRGRAMFGRLGPIASFAGTILTPRPFPRSTRRSGDGKRRRAKALASTPTGETFASVARARQGGRSKPTHKSEGIPSPLVGEGEGGGSGHSFPAVRTAANRKIQRDPPPRPAPAIGRPEGRPSHDGLSGAGEPAGRC